jgi:WD40 repeat protein
VIRRRLNNSCVALCAPTRDPPGACWSFPAQRRRCIVGLTPRSIGGAIRPTMALFFFVLTHGRLGDGPDAYRELLPDALIKDPTGLYPLWFDLRGYRSRTGWGRVFRSALDRKIRAESGSWNKVRIYDEERFRLAARVLSVRVGQDLSPEDLVRKWEAAWRLKRRLRRVQMWAVVAMLAAAGAILDRVLEAQNVEQLTAVAEAAAGDQDYERAMKTALSGLPLDGDFFWRHGWSGVGTRKLLAILAGASQMSAYVGQLAADSDAQGKTQARAPLQTAEFDSSGTHIVTASQAGAATIWDSRSRTPIVTCSQDEAFAGYKSSGAEGSRIWVRDSRFGPPDGTILSVGRYGGWIWSPTCKGCEGKKPLACEAKIRLTGHTADVRTGTFSTDGSRVVTTSDDESVMEWNATSGKPIGKLDLPQSDLPKGFRYTTGAEFSPNGKFIVVGRRDGLLAIVDAETRKVTQTLKNSGAAIWSVHFDRTGQRVLASSGDGFVAIWDLPTNSRVLFFRQASGVGKSQFSPDQRYIVTTSLDNVARIWDATTLEQVFALKGHTRSVLSASFSPNGTQIVTASDDGTARLWNIGTSVLPSVVTVTSPIQSSALSNDGQRFAIGTTDGRVIIYDLGPTGELKEDKALPPGAGAITSLSFGSGSATLVIATARGKIFRWQAGTAKPEDLTTLPEGETFAASSPDGTSTAVASSLAADKVGATVLKAQGKERIVLAEASYITGIEFDRDGKKILAGSDAGRDDEKRVLVWDATSGSKQRQLKHRGKVLSAHFSRDGARIATSTIDRKAYVWGSSSDHPLQVFSGHTYDVNSARLSADANTLVTASSDRTVRIWDVTTGLQMLKFSVGREANDAFFTSDDKHIVVATAGGDILAYDVTWAVGRRDKALKERTCAEKLSEFDEVGLCSRTGPFSSRFWQQKLGDLKKAIDWLFDTSKKAIDRLFDTSHA